MHSKRTYPSILCFPLRCRTANLLGSTNRQISSSGSIESSFRKGILILHVMYFFCKHDTFIDHTCWILQVTTQLCANIDHLIHGILDHLAGLWRDHRRLWATMRLFLFWQLDGYGSDCWWIKSCNSWYCRYSTNITVIILFQPSHHEAVLMSRCVLAGSDSVISWTQEDLNTF